MDENSIQNISQIVNIYCLQDEHRQEVHIYGEVCWLNH